MPLKDTAFGPPPGERRVHVPTGCAWAAEAMQLAATREAMRRMGKLLGGTST
jgi:hypothetical protein